MFVVNAHAATSPGESLAPTMSERRDPGLHDVAQLVVRLLIQLQFVIRLLTRLGATP